MFEELKNPYYLQDSSGAFYNKYPEFQIWEEGKQAVLSHLASQAPEEALLTGTELDNLAMADGHKHTYNIDVNTLLKAALAKATPIIRAQCEKDCQERVEQSRVEDRKAVGKWLDGLCKHAPIYSSGSWAYRIWLPKDNLEALQQGKVNPEDTGLYGPSAQREHRQDKVKEKGE